MLLAGGLELFELRLCLLLDSRKTALEDDVLILGCDLSHAAPPLDLGIDDSGVHADPLRLLGQAQKDDLLEGPILPVGKDLSRKKLFLFLCQHVGIART